jgi:hypothetical protein
MEVYSATPVVARLPVAITSVAALGDALYIGGEDGSLRRAVSEPPSAAAAAPRFEVAETNAKFNRDKKPVRGLHAVPEWGLLLSVCGAWPRGAAPRECNPQHPAGRGGAARWQGPSPLAAQCAAS